MPVYLVAHTNAKGQNVAQVTIRARSETNVRKRFRKDYPLRTILTIGKRG